MSDSDVPTDALLRCSVLIAVDRQVLLVHRTGPHRDDWVLPGGTPRPGETLASCARREVLEETGIRIVPNRVAFVLESVHPESRSTTVDVVFRPDGPLIGQARECEAGLVPHWMPLADLAALRLRPPIAGHIRNLLNSPAERSAAYLGNLWRPPHTDPVNTAVTMQKELS